MHFSGKLSIIVLPQDSLISSISFIFEAVNWLRAAVLSTSNWLPNERVSGIQKRVGKFEIFSCRFQGSMRFLIIETSAVYLPDINKALGSCGCGCHTCPDFSHVGWKIVPTGEQENPDPPKTAVLLLCESLPFQKACHAGQQA